MKTNLQAFISNTLIIVLSFIATFILLGCQSGSSGIVKISPDTYMLSRSSAAGAFTNMAKLRADVIREANAFAESQGKIAIPISLNSNVPRVGFPSYDYQFRVVDKDDPEAQRTSLVPRPDIVIEKTEKISADIVTKDKTEKSKDVYTELIKLDDLRKRGIITEEEFETMKKKVLSENR